MASVDIYNNAGVDVSVSAGGKVTPISPGESKRVLFSSASMLVESELGSWAYGRVLIPGHGEDGPYFDGTVYVQIEANGQIYALQKLDARPAAEFPVQPEGFPLGPGS
jgi:hypothetical protein